MLPRNCYGAGYTLWYWKPARYWRWRRSTARR